MENVALGRFKLARYRDSRRGCDVMGWGEMGWDASQRDRGRMEICAVASTHHGGKILYYYKLANS